MCICLSFCSYLTEITIPDLVTYIGAFAFQSCMSLKRIVIGRSVNYIGHWALGITPSLKEVIFLGNIEPEYADGHTPIYVSNPERIVVPRNYTSVQSYQIYGNHTYLFETKITDYLEDYSEFDQ